MWDSPTPFRDREDAGRQLAQALLERGRDRPWHDPLVLGVPRGGVAVAAVIAEELNADLDVVIARKLRAPFQPELAIGSLGEDDQVYTTADFDRVPGVDEQTIQQEIQTQRRAIDERRQLYRGGRAPEPIRDRTVIVTDDGIATGSTMIAALDVVRGQQPRELVAALPVAPASRLDVIREHCDDLVVLRAPQRFMAVGQFYETFDQTPDEEVVRLLERARAGG